MALDGAFLHIIKTELEQLIGGRVEKIHQPSKEELVLGIRTRTASYKLLISASPASARVHLTERPAENPAKPPMFCMLLRKRLGSGKLAAVRQDGLERILFLDFDTVNELGDQVKLTLACEIMGRYSNLIVIGENGKIIDSIKRVDAEMSRERLILPGMLYELPPRTERLNFLTASQEDITAALEEKKALGNAYLSKTLINIFEGISPVLAREWIFFAARESDIPLDALDENITQRLLFAINKTAGEIAENKCRFTVIRTPDGVLKDFCFTEIHQYGALMITKEMPSADITLDYFYSQRDSEARMKQRAGDLYRLLLNAVDRISRRTALQREELKATENKDMLRLKGDLLAANLWQIEKGMNAADLPDYNDENGKTVHIELDMRLTPSQNMQRYYSLYRKADTAEKILAEKIAQGEEELAYVESVFDALTRAKGEDEISELRAELAREGYIRRASVKQNQKVRPPLMFTSPDGYRIAVGRNNLQNDILTLKTAEKSDIWLHTKDIPGSHVIIFTENTTPPDSTILYAAQLAAYHSKAKNSSQVPVDYVPVKLVKKPAGAKPGKVIFTGNRTLYVTPPEEVSETDMKG